MCSSLKFFTCAHDFEFPIALFCTHTHTHTHTHHHHHHHHHHRSSSDGTEQRHSTSASLQDKKLKLGDSSKDTCTGGHTTASTQDHGDPKVVVAPTKLNTEETSDMQCKTQTMFSSLPGMAEYSNSSDDDEDDN